MAKIIKYSTTPTDKALAALQSLGPSPVSMQQYGFLHTDMGLPYDNRFFNMSQSVSCLQFDREFENIMIPFPEPPVEY